MALGDGSPLAAVPGQGLLYLVFRKAQLAAYLGVGQSFVMQQPHDRHPVQEFIWVPPRRPGTQDVV